MDPQVHTGVLTQLCSHHIYIYIYIYIYTYIIYTKSMMLTNCYMQYSKHHLFDKTFVLIQLYLAVFYQRHTQLKLTLGVYRFLD